ncbi:MAG: UvrD-helicase domain-containing protein [Polyangiaceae bacterium]|nr:UvrD-helicase domain-containing protein [Polyangiaceae bacterium]
MTTFADLASRPRTSWSRYQQAIFQDVAGGTGHTVVLARAGSGKTTTLVEALRHVPRKERVLMMAFNKSIERELKKQAPQGAEVRTFHGYGFALLGRAFGGVDVDENKVPALIEKTLGHVSLEQRRALQRGVSLAKNTLAKTAKDVERLIDDFELDVPRGEEGGFAALVMELLDACAENPRVVDYDDMVWLPLRLGLRPRSQFGRIFVDETQDLNRAQVLLALRACSPEGRICAVGDDRQAIYSWRGADPEMIPRLIDKLRARVLPLSVSYRCARAIIALAQEIVPDIEAAPGAEKGDVRTVSEAELRRAVQPGDFVLGRVNAPLVGLCLSLLAEGRPATIMGRDIGTSLASLVRRSGTETTAELDAWLTEWAQSEATRLLLKGKDPSIPRDKAECVRRIAEGTRTTADVIGKIDALFNDTDDKKRIVLSSTHKAKGLERDRAWVLKDTYRRGLAVEEDNLWYVAVTRAKRELRLVEAAAL